MLEIYGRESTNTRRRSGVGGPIGHLDFGAVCCALSLDAGFAFVFGGDGALFAGRGEDASQSGWADCVFWRGGVGEGFPATPACACASPDELGSPVHLWRGVVWGPASVARVGGWGDVSGERFDDRCSPDESYVLPDVCVRGGWVFGGWGGGVLMVCRRADRLCWYDLFPPGWIFRR